MAKIYCQNSNTYVCDAMQEHVDALKHRLRKSDIEEVWASHHLSGEDALQLAFQQSAMRFSIIHRGHVVAMFGAAPYPDYGASVWLLGSDDLETIRIFFLRHSRYCIGLMLDKYGYLSNYVDARNAVSLEWIRWCGFKVYDATPYGAERLPFHYFEMRGD